jgi:predicted Zn-dependent protease with MMP-like domain
LPISDWFSAGRGSLQKRLAQALEASRAGDPGQAIETIAERFPEALQALDAGSETRDAGWFRLAARLAYRAGEMEVAMVHAIEALAIEEEAETWHLLGRLRVWLNRGDATAAFIRAARLQPDRFVKPHRVSHARFVQMAETALAAVPDRFQVQLANTLIVVDDLPDRDAVREGEDPDLLGVYEGGTLLAQDLPERIVLYQRNHENICGDEAELGREVVETMRHEIGHHFGMAEEDLPY